MEKYPEYETKMDVVNEIIKNAKIEKREHDKSSHVHSPTYNMPLGDWVCSNLDATLSPFDEKFMFKKPMPLNKLGDLNDVNELKKILLECITYKPAAALGSIRSEKKAASSRENGKKGGRPVTKRGNDTKAQGMEGMR